jgi:hypothetical protein
VDRNHFAPLRGAVLALALGTVAGCTIENPELPTFESEWLIPLGTTVKTVDELLGDQPSVVTQPDGTLALQSDGQLDAVAFGDQLDLTLAGISTIAQIGSIDLPPSSPISFDYRLADLYPASVGLAGLSLPVPPFTFGTTSTAQDLPGFTAATISSGGIQVSVRNGLPVPVGGSTPPEQIQIELLDATTLSVLGAVSIASAIAAGGQSQEFLDLAGVTMPDSVAVRLSGGSVGSSGSSVTIDPNASLAVDVQTTALVVSAARAPIGAQGFQDSSSVLLPDSIQIQSATIASATLDVSLRNDLPIDVTATMTISSLLDAADQPFRLALPAAAATSASRSIDLSPYHFDFGAGLGQQLDVLVDVSTPGSGGSSVTIQSTDVVSLDIAPLDIRFQSVRGVIDPIIVDLASTTTTLELPAELDDLQLARAELTLALQTTLGMAAMINLDLDGRNRDGVVVPLAVAVNLPAAPPGQQLVYNVVLNETNSTIIDFLNNLPTTIDVSGTASVGDGVTVGEVAVDDSLAARYSISAPMTVAILAQVIDIEATSISLDADLRDEIDQRVVSLDLEAEVLSSLPIAARAWIGLDADSTAVYDAPQLQLGPIDIPAAGAIRNDGTRPTATSNSQVLVQQSDIPVVTQPQLYQGVRIEIPGTAGNFVTVRAGDTLEIRGFLRARVRVGELR